MGSFSISEILTILVVILVIFGPNRLPEFARKTGKLIAQARQAVASFTAELESDYGDTVNPIRDLTDELGGIKQDLTRTVTNLGAAVGSDGAGEEGSDPVTHDGDSVGSRTEAEEGESAVTTPIAAVPSASGDPGQPVEPVTIEDLVADATAGSSGVDADRAHPAADAPHGDEASQEPSTDDQTGEVA
jgi:sec-independent protein translocase protein TatB